MKLITFKKIVDESKPKTKHLNHILFAFIGGGCVGVIAQLIQYISTSFIHLSEQYAGILTFTIIVIVTAILTVTNTYKKLVNIFGAGLFVPSTGFANSVISSAMEARSEGPIYGIGSRVFFLAGSVILYGVVGSFFYGIIILILQVIGLL